jgi:hypothetical protein
MDATHIPDHLTELDQQIAEVEREIAALRTAIVTRNPGRGRKALQRTLAAKLAEHEQLVRRVQWATVGAAKPGEVL